MLCRLLLTFLLLACMRSASAQHGGRYLDPSAPVNWQSPLNRGLVSWWMALPDQQRGVIFRDLCRRNHGTLTNMDPATDWVSARGRPGGFGALDFDGSNDVVLAGSAITPATTQSLTMCGWARFSSFSSVNPVVLINAGSNGPNFWFMLYAGSTPRAEFAAFDGTNNPILNGATSLQANVWVHLTGVRDCAADTIAIFVNGVFDGSTTDTTTAAPTSPAVHIGKQNGFARNTTGLLDDVRIYNRALSAAEVWQLYQDSRQGYPQTLAWQGAPRWAPQGSPPEPPASGGNFLPLLTLAPKPTWEGVDKNWRAATLAMIGALAP